MEKVQFSKDDFFEWWDNDGKSHWRRRSDPCRENAKETPKEMVRALEGIFCKGRYRSWKPWMGKLRTLKEKNYYFPGNSR